MNDQYIFVRRLADGRYMVVFDGARYVGYFLDDEAGLMEALAEFRARIEELAGKKPRDDAAAWAYAFVHKHVLGGDCV